VNHFARSFLLNSCLLSLLNFSYSPDSAPNGGYLPVLMGMGLSYGFSSSVSGMLVSGGEGGDMVKLVACGVILRNPIPFGNRGKVGCRHQAPVPDGSADIGPY
jgi:hypothetical protein